MFKQAKQSKVWLYLMLTCGTLLYFLLNIQRSAVPGAIFNQLQSDLGLSGSNVIALGAVFTYVYAINQLFIGLLTDRYGGGRVILAGGLLFCLGGIIFPFAKSLGMLYFSRGLLGIGASAIYMSMVKEIARHFEKEISVMLGVLIFIGYTGGIVANGPFVSGAAAIGWRMMLVLIAAVMTAAYLAFAVTQFMLPKAPVQKVPFNFAPYIKILKNKHNRIVYLSCALSYSSYYVLQFILGKKFLEDFCLMSELHAGWVLSIMGGISAVSGLAVAALSKCFGNRRRIFIFCPYAISLATYSIITVALLLDIRTAAIAGLFLLLPFSANIAPITTSLLRETNDLSAFACTAGFNNFICHFSVAALASIAGMLLEIFPPEIQGNIQIFSRKSYLLVFLLLAALSAVAMWCACFIRETYGKCIGPQKL